MKKISSKVTVRNYILAQSTNISSQIQNDIYTNLIVNNLPEKTNYDSCLKLLNIMYDSYKWDVEESEGKKPLIKNRKSLNYYAVLMENWINSKPLKLIIANTINYMDRNNIQILVEQPDYELFNPKKPLHINILINNIISDFENILQFKIKNYVSNYILLLNAKNFNITSNWSDYLEYGTDDKFIIEIQNIGFPRYLASFLKKNHSDCFLLDDGEIIDFNVDKLKRELDKQTYKYEFEELSKLLEWT